MMNTPTIFSPIPHARLLSVPNPVTPLMRTCRAAVHWPHWLPALSALTQRSLRADTLNIFLAGQGRGTLPTPCSASHITHSHSTQNTRTGSESEAAAAFPRMTVCTQGAEPMAWIPALTHLTSLSLGRDATRPLPSLAPHLTALTALRELSLGGLMRAVANSLGLQAAIPAWVASMRRLTSIDMEDVNIGCTAASSALLYGTPSSFTRLACGTLALPPAAAGGWERQRVPSLMQLKVRSASLELLASLHLAPECSIDRIPSHACACWEMNVGQGGVPQLQLLAAAAPNLRRLGGYVRLVGAVGSRNGEEGEGQRVLGEDESERVMQAWVRAVSGSTRISTMELSGFTVRKSVVMGALLDALPGLGCLSFR